MGSHWTALLQVRSKFTCFPSTTGAGEREEPRQHTNAAGKSVRQSDRILFLQSLKYYLARTHLVYWPTLIPGTAVSEDSWTPRAENLSVLSLTPPYLVSVWTRGPRVSPSFIFHVQNPKTCQAVLHWKCPWLTPLSSSNWCLTMILEPVPSLTWSLFSTSRVSIYCKNDL